MLRSQFTEHIAQIVQGDFVGRTPLPESIREKNQSHIFVFVILGGVSTAQFMLILIIVSRKQENAEKYIKIVYSGNTACFSPQKRQKLRNLTFYKHNNSL